MSKLQRAVLLLVAMLGLAACTVGGADRLPQQHSTLPVAELPPFPTDELAAGLSPRLASAVPMSVTVFGANWESASGGVAVFGDAARMFRLGPEFGAWTTYRLPTVGLRLGNAALQLTSGGDNLWLLRANFQSGRWDASGPYGAVGTVNLSLDQPQYYGASGSQYIALLAYEAEPAPIFEEIDYEVLVPETVRHDLGTTGTSEALALVERPAGPGVIFYDSDEQHMRYARAEVAEPTSAADWSFFNMELFPTPEPQSLSAVYYEGRIVAAYYSPGTGNTVIAREPGEGGPAIWSRKTISDGGPCDLAIIDGRLSVAFHREDLLDDDGDGQLGKIMLAYPADGDPLGEWTEHKAGAAELTPIRPRLAEVAGVPALAWKLDNAGMLRYAYANTARPEAAADWAAHTLEANPTTDTLRLIGHRALPCLTFAESGNLMQLFGRTATPDTFFEWDGGTLTSGSRLHDEVSLGNPLLVAAALNDGGEEILVLMRFDVPAGLFWPVETAADGFLALNAAAVAGLPAIAYIRDGPAGGTVAYARQLAE